MGLYLSSLFIFLLLLDCLPPTAYFFIPPRRRVVAQAGAGVDASGQVCGGDDDFALGVDEDAEAGAFFAFVHAVNLRLVRAGEVVLGEDGRAERAA